VPVPSALLLLEDEPARVVTTPVGVIFRMVLDPASVTKTLPAPSTAMPVGETKRAALPAAST